MDLEKPDYKSLTNKTPKKEVSQIRATFEVVGDAIPATFGLLFIFIAETINIIFIGRYDDPKLIAGIGIGTLYINATGYILGAGLIGGIDTLCSQTFGAKEYKLLGVFSNIAKLVILAFFILICLPFVYFSSNLLNMIGQFEEVSLIASDFARSMLPSIFFGLQYNCSLRYLQSMNIFLPGMFITLFTALLHPLWCHIFINYFEYGVIGAGISMGVTQLFNFIIVTVYIHVKNPCPESNFFINSDCFDSILIFDYLKKAVPAAILFAADWIGIEALTFMSSYISEDSLAANVCLFNFITLIFMLPLGLSFASTTLVGNSIGAKDEEKAKRYTWAALLSGTILITITTILVYTYRYEIPYVYTPEPNIAILVTGLLEIYVCFSILDCIQIILHGVIKGLGKQQLASVIALIILYPINMPMAYMLAFKFGYGLFGLWYSYTVSIVLLTVSYSTILYMVNWKDVSYKTLQHFKEENLEIIRKHSHSRSTSPYVSKDK